MARDCLAIVICLFSLTAVLGACAQPAAAPPAEPAPVTQALEPCGAPSMVSAIEPLAPVTPAPASPTSAPAASPTPAPTPRPAPQVDRVGFPEGYKESFKQFYAFDRTDAKSISFICANDVATSVNPGQPFPDGSVLAFESWRPKEDANGNLVKDPNGHLIRQTLNTIFMMRKGQGLGDEYGNLKTGDWAYVAYRPDKSHATPPQLTANCAACHQAAGKDRDWVFRGELFFAKDRYAQTPSVGPNEVSLSRMNFFSNNLTVKAGTTVKWTNSPVDKIDHTVAALDSSFNSAVLKPGESFSFSFDKPGTYPYVCSIHPEQMRATIRVTD